MLVQKIGTKESSKCFISVIIIVYDRSDFIIDALKSLQKQTLDKDLFEVILGTNVQLRLPNFSGLNVYVINSDITRGSAKYIQGIEFCHGEVVCLFDDDDVFTPDKLQLVYTIFKGHSSLIFYRNEYLRSKNVDNISPPSIFSSSKGSRLRFYNVSNSSQKIFWKLKGYGSMSQFSTMSVRKIYFDNQEIKSLFLNPDIRVGDSLLFMSLFSFEKPVEIAIDSKILTIYRVHNSFSHLNWIDSHNARNISNEVTSLTLMKNSFTNMAIIFQNVDFLKRCSALEEAIYSLKISLLVNEEVGLNTLRKIVILSFLERKITPLVYIFIYFLRMTIPDKIRSKVEHAMSAIKDHFLL